MKFRTVITKKLEVPELGIIVPGQEFEVSNERFMDIFKDKTLFEEVKEVVKKIVKKEDGE